MNLSHCGDQVPEYPDITAYREALEERLAQQHLTSLNILNPFVLRTVDPTVDDLLGPTIVGVETLGKRLVLAFDTDLFLVMHLMIAGRLRWMDRATGSSPAPGTRKSPNRKQTLLHLTCTRGDLYMTEAGSKRRASVHILRGRAALDAMDPGGLDVLASNVSTFVNRVRSQNHTLKRTLTDPAILSGIGNAYSDEILHRARLSPMQLSQKATDIELHTLYEAIQSILSEWTERLREQRIKEGGFPKKVTAFRREMAAHGKYGEPCPTCEAPIQRIVYANNETNYCARCQTRGKILKDRALSRLLKDSWPDRIDDV